MGADHKKISLTKPGDHVWSAPAAPVKNTLERYLRVPTATKAICQNGHPLPRFEKGSTGADHKKISLAKRGDHVWSAPAAPVRKMPLKS
mgnify:CR=1 FL=1